MNITEQMEADGCFVSENVTCDLHARIKELEVVVAATRIQYEHARRMVHDLGMTLRRLNNQGLAINHKQAETMLRAFDEWKTTGLHPHHPWVK
jgi:hypothetical protein